jgi:hypothetical protein
VIEVLALAGLVVAGLIGAVVTASAKGRPNAGRMESLVRAAVQAGLEDVRSVASFTESPRVWGRRGALGVVLERYRQADARDVGTTIAITGLPLGLSLQRDVTGLSPAAWLRAPSVATGDEAFDRAMRVSGATRPARALLDASTRALVLDVFCGRLALDGRASHTREHRAHLADGQLSFDCPRRDTGDDPDLVAGYLAELLRLTDALCRPESLEARLLGNVRTDPEPGVRLACLRELLDGEGQAPGGESREALLAAVADGDESVQLEAAIALGQDGRAALLEIATRSWSSDSCAARAVVALRSALPPEPAAALLRHALREHRWETAAACLETLGFARSLPHELAADALRTPNGSVAAAAARALGRAGAAPSLLLLRDAQARFAQDGAVVQAVRAAIDSIRDRLGDAHEGQVSLVDTESGRVTVTDAEAGQVSLPEPAHPRPRGGRR